MSLIPKQCAKCFMHDCICKPEARPDLSKTQRGLLNAINEFNPPKPEPTPAEAPSLGSELVGALREANAGHDAQAPGAREFLFYKNEPVDGSVNGRMCCEVNPAKWDDPKWTEDYRTLRLIEYAAYGALERELSKAQERAAFYKSCARSGENPDDWGKDE